jgi:hypothetical protein
METLYRLSRLRIRIAIDGQPQALLGLPEIAAKIPDDVLHVRHHGIGVLENLHGIEGLPVRAHAPFIGHCAGFLLDRRDELRHHLLEGFFLPGQHFACVVEDDIALADTALRRLGVRHGSRKGYGADGKQGQKLLSHDETSHSLASG